MPYAGIQNDEALFAAPLFTAMPHDLVLRAFHHDVPLMLMSYLGTTKTWLYAVIFQLWPPGIVSLRLPPILIGAATLVLFHRLVALWAGPLAATIACLLLATDASFVLTNTFDWGPVAIQHLTLIGGLLLVYKGVRSSSASRIGGGFLLIGLGMWDKAIFIWMLSGTGVATLLLFPAEVRRAFTRRNVRAAAIGFAIGAAPLILYNIRQPLRTFRGNAVYSSSELPQKFEVAKRMLAGNLMFGYLVNEDWAANPRAPGNALERGSLAVSDLAGEHRTSLQVYAFLASLAAIPLWWNRRKLVLFALVTMIVAWLQMAFTKDAGGGGHHVVLLYPFPHLIMGVAIAGACVRLRWRPHVMAALVTGVLCLSNLLVYNQYLSQFIRDGAGPVWSEAVLPLSTAANAWEDRNVFVADWGIDPVLRMLHGGRLTKLWTASDVVSHELSASDRATLANMLALPGAYFITHTAPFEVQKGSRARLLSVAQALAYRPRTVAVINDYNRRAVFEVIEFVH